MKNSILTMLGFAQKSGNLVIGETQCRRDIVTRKVSLLIMAEDINETTRRKMIDVCNEHQVKYVTLFDKETLSTAIGKMNYGLFGITSKKFSRAIIDKLDRSD